MRKRELVHWLQDTYDISQRRACRLMGIVRASFPYQSRRPDTSASKLRMRELAAARVRYGYRRIHVLLRREGWVLNHKPDAGRVYGPLAAPGAPEKGRSLTFRMRNFPGADQLQRNTMIRLVYLWGSSTVPNFSPA